MHICNHCQRTFSNSGGLATHSPYCKINPNRVQRSKSPDAHRKKGSIGWNKGLVGDPRLKKSEETKQKLRDLENKGRAKTPAAETLRKARIKAKAILNNGGYRQGSGRGKKGWYKGIFCDSSWELAYVIWCHDHGKNITRCTEKFNYSYNGKSFKYHPDFVVNNIIVEIKGYKTAQWLEKLKQCPVPIEVLYKEELQHIITYVKLHYGKDYINKYE